MNDKERAPNLTDLFKSQASDARLTTTSPHLFNKMSLASVRLKAASHLRPRIIAQTDHHFKIELSESNQMIGMITKVYMQQDLHLDPYRMIFFCYHPKAHRFVIWKSYNFQKVSKGRLSRSSQDKTIDTLELRERRINRLT
jgi:hypothetical protein